MPKFETLGDRCKFFEKNFANGPYLSDKNPILARIDGRSFHTFTKGLPRPFCKNLAALMAETTQFLMQESHPIWGYCQSDEISLCWLASHDDQQVFFDARVQKMTSQLAALATLWFNKNLKDFLPEKTSALPTFDARIWNVPNKKEAANYFLWRQIDATKNAISMAAQSVFSHKELHGKNGVAKQEMLWSKGINFNDYPAEFKRGQFFRRDKVALEHLYSQEEIAQLPPMHEARQGIGLTKEITVIRSIRMPAFTKVENREAVLFDQEEPRVFNTKETIDV